MTDAPEPPPEQRLPAPRPPDRVSAERFTAAPSLKAIDGLTPERSAGIVRQSSSARWVGFLTFCFVTLFIVGYWFYELGFPLGISEPRLAQEIEHQQVTAVERGYNVYQANCARCHGPNGMGPDEPDAADVGYIGPTLNSQEKLFTHLNENYLHNVLLGRRPVCLRQCQVGDAGLVGPGQSAGPAQLPPDRRAHRVPPGDERPRLHREGPGAERARHRPETGEAKTFTGWRDPNYKPDPGATPYPGLLPQRARRRRRLRAAHRRPRSTRTPPSSPSRRRPARQAPGSNRHARGQRRTRPSRSSSTTRTRPRPTTSCSRTRAGPT